MSMERVRTSGLQRSPILVGAVAGLVAGVPMGFVLQFGTDLLPIVGAVFGTQSLLVGWALHLTTSTVFGALFGWLVLLPIFRTLTDTTGECVLLGVVHSYALMIFMIGAVIPSMVRWRVPGEELSLLQIPGPSGEALLAAGAFAFAHLVYGTVLGAGYALLEDVSAEPEARGPDGERAPTDSN